MGTRSLTTHRRNKSTRRAAALAHIQALDMQCDRKAALARDPVRFARAFVHPRDREVAALLCALLAFGRVEVIATKLRELFHRLGPSPAQAAMEWSEARRTTALKGFRHRTFRGEDIARLLGAAGDIVRRDGALYTSLERAYARHQDLRAALMEFADELKARAWPEGIPRTARHLLPDLRGPSACKRWWLLARWLVRPDDGVDLGLVNIPPRALVIPLDVHVHRVARSLGLTSCRTPCWRAARQVTDALRALDPDDPVRFDFAICHLEIERHRARLRPSNACLPVLS